MPRIPDQHRTRDADADPEEIVRRQRHHREARSEGDVAGASDLRPIGLKRLLELREAVRNGTYPATEYAVKGLSTLFGRSRRRRSDGT